MHSVPVLTVAAVAAALLVVGTLHPQLAARLYGGPTEGASVLAFRLEVVERTGDFEAAAAIGAVRIEVELSDGRRDSWQGWVDAGGMAAVRLEPRGGPVTGPVLVRVTSPHVRHDLARGRVHLSPDEWRRAAVWRGGWLNGQQAGELRVSVAPGRGVLAVPFVEPLLVEVREADSAVAGALVQFLPEGLDLHLPRDRRALRTNASGRVVVRVAPREAVCALRVTATHPSGKQGQWYARLPVVQGALHARLRQGRLEVAAAIVREAAYFAVISERQRWAGGPVLLVPDGEGGAVGQIALPRLPSESLWAVVSTEPDLASASVLGWPLLVGWTDQSGVDALMARGPRRSLTVSDRLLLDGAAYLAAREARRQARALRLCVGLVAGALALLALWVVEQYRRSRNRLHRHLEGIGAPLEVTARVAGPRLSMLFRLLMALGCVALYFVLLALWLLYRPG
jgi:hypothetical protein